MGVIPPAIVAFLLLAGCGSSTRIIGEPPPQVPQFLQVKLANGMALQGEARFTANDAQPDLVQVALAAGTSDALWGVYGYITMDEFVAGAADMTVVAVTANADQANVSLGPVGETTFSRNGSVHITMANNAIDADASGDEVVPGGHAEGPALLFCYGHFGDASGPPQYDLYLESEFCSKLRFFRVQR